MLLEELLKYSKHFKTIASANSGNHKLDAVLRRLILLDMSVMNPFTLNLLEYRRCGEISDQEVIETLKSVETYLFRRWVCKVPTNALNKVFETLHSEVLRGVKDGGAYPEVLNKVLLSKEGSGHFPDDAEFIQAFEERDFYRIASYKYYLFDRLENGDSLERVNVIDNLREESFSVEHIMPQTLSTSWQQDLGDDFAAIHARWLNRERSETMSGSGGPLARNRRTEY